MIRAAGRRPPGLCSRRGLVQRDAPPIFFSILWKRKRAVHGPKEKTAFWRTPARSRLCADGGRRIGASVDVGWPSGTLGSSAIFAAAVPWRIVRRASGCKNAFDQLLFPRVPLRYALPGRLWQRAALHRAESLPRSCRGRCLHRPVPHLDFGRIWGSAPTGMCRAPSNLPYTPRECRAKVARPRAPQKRFFRCIAGCNFSLHYRR